MMTGVTVIGLDAHSDERGTLVVLEPPTGLPFVARRVFFISASSPDVSRGGHALNCDELLVVPQGALTLDLDNGEERMSLRVSDPMTAVWLRAGVWLRLRDISPGAVVAVMSPALYAETVRFDAPQPHMLPAEQSC